MAKARITTIPMQDLPWPEVRCLADSGRLIVSADRTPSGRRYEFTTNQVQPIHPADYNFLLALEAKAAACCGSAGAPQRYFEGVTTWP